MEKRKPEKSGVVVSPMGLGCWAIGGPFEFDGRPAGWGEVDDAESVRAIHLALELRVNFVDTADVYGCGRSERVLGRALEDRRDTRRWSPPRSGFSSTRAPSRRACRGRAGAHLLGAWGVRATSARERRCGSRRGSAWTTVFGNGRRRAGIDTTAATNQSATRRNVRQPRERKSA
jgi:hypothetical protein